MNHIPFIYTAPAIFHNFIIENPDEKKEIQNRNNFNYYYSDKLKNKTLYLLKSRYTSFIFNIMPRHFTITTNNNNHNSYKFNIELLRDTSPLISDILKISPPSLQYHLNIDDKTDTLKKFEKIYQGKQVYFEENELSTVNKIISLLNIENITNKLKQQSSYYNPKLSFGLSYGQFFIYLKNEAPQSFTIITRKNINATYLEFVHQKYYLI